MLRYTFAFLAFATPVTAQDCGSFCTANFWITANGSSVQERVDTLLNSGGDIDQGGVPLQMAIRFGNPQSIQTLIEAGVDVNLASSSNGIPPLSQVLNSPNPALAPMFVEAGARIDTQDNRGNTALYYAVAILTEPQLAAYLIGAGADVNHVNNAGKTALAELIDLSAYLGNMNKIWVIANAAQLIRAGALLDVQDNDGKTPLHYAAEGSVSEWQVMWLLDVGANGSIRDNDGLTAYDHVAENLALNFTEALNALRSAAGQ